jgi:spore coat polysaccharide biosynthesis protein SpsF (cytidylyltransferase family)
LLTFFTEKDYQELVENAIMQTQLRGKYKRKCDSILDELEDEPDIKNTNRDLEALAEPAKKS